MDRGRSNQVAAAAAQQVAMLKGEMDVARKLEVRWPYSCFVMLYPKASSYPPGMYNRM